MVTKSSLSTLLLVLIVAVASAFCTNNKHHHHRQQRCSSSISRPSFFISRSQFITTTLAAASSQQEDLELTRQLVLNHIAKINDNNKSNDDNSNSNNNNNNANGQSVTNTDSSTDIATSTAIDHDDNDYLMIKTALGQQNTDNNNAERTPVWLFRQAGRHLPEYQQYKQSTGYNFVELLAHADCVTECTLQPVRRYRDLLDAAILFSDILVVPQALGMRITMPGGVGIQVPEPLTSPDDMYTRLEHVFSNKDNTEYYAQLVRDNLSHVLQAVTQIRQQLKAENLKVPLIGFSAAPWTLLFYMVGGSSKKNTDIGIRWLREHPKASRDLLDILTLIVIEYLSAQVEAGAQLLQVFEAMGMMVGTEQDGYFIEYCLPCLAQIATEIKRRHPQVPLMVFGRGACQYNDRLAQLGYDVITMDGSVDRATARSFISNIGKYDVTLQGNYDPAELIEENGKTVETVRASVKQMLLELGGPQRLIANLGEGLSGKESPKLVEAFIKAVHDESAVMFAEMRNNENNNAATAELAAKEQQEVVN